MEAALIDIYLNLTNIQRGHNSIERGISTIQDLINENLLEEANLNDTNHILNNVNIAYQNLHKEKIVKRNKTITKEDIFNITKGVWRIN